MILHFVRGAVFSCLLLAGTAAGAQDVSGPPYENQLIKLAETLGSLHSLSHLCGDTTMQWRDQMNRLLTVEKVDNTRRKNLISAFNDSYRSYTDNYNSCTSQALKAIERFKSQGETLTAALLAQYGH